MPHTCSLVNVVDWSVRCSCQARRSHFSQTLVPKGRAVICAVPDNTPGVSACPEDALVSARLERHFVYRSCLHQVTIRRCGMIALIM